MIPRRLAAALFAAAYLLRAAPAAAGDPAPLPSLPDAALTDECGLPFFLHEGRILRNPAYLAQVAADPGAREPVRDAAWAACLDRLRRVRAGTRECEILMYDYHYPYHGRLIEPPFPSAYAQAWWVRACLARHRSTGDPDARERLRRAADAFRVPRAQGGFLDPPAAWFEELPGTRILNGHLDACLALLDAADALADPDLGTFAVSALHAAAERLVDFDTGDWSRYDLDPDGEARLFSFDWEGPPGAPPPALVSLAATRGGGAMRIAAAEPSAWTGAVRLAGNWPPPREALPGVWGRAFTAPRFTEPAAGDLYGIATRAIARLEWPPEPRAGGKTPGETPGSARPALRLTLAGGGTGRLALRVRDTAFAEEYRFRDFAAVDCGGGGTREILLPLSPWDLAPAVGDRYHRLHIRLLRACRDRLAARSAADAGRFGAFADRFESYLVDGPPRDERPKAPRSRYTRTDEVTVRDRAGAVWPPGNEPARLVDGDGDSVLILRPEELGRTFEVAFARPVALLGLGVDFYAGPFVPGELAVDTGVTEAFTFREERPERFWINLSSAPARDRIAFRFGGVSERGPVIVRELRFLVDPDRPALEALAAALPLPPADRRPAWAELLTLDAALRARFPLGRPSGGSIREIVESGVAQCADRVALLGGILDLCGIRWRPINFHNSPNIGDGHTALEIWHAGGWRYLDPSFGFWVPGPAGARSFAELRAHPELAASGLAAAAAPDRRGLDTPEFFRRAAPAGPAGPLHPMTFPVDVGRAGVALGSFGPSAAADSCRDLDSMVTPGVPAGLAYIGQSLEQRSVSLRFSGEAAGATFAVTLVPAYRTDDKFELKLCAEGGVLDGPAVWRPAFVGYRTDESGILRVRFAPERAGAALTFGFTPGRYPSYMELDAIRAERAGE